MILIDGILHRTEQAEDFLDSLEEQICTFRPALSLKERVEAMEELGKLLGLPEFSPSRLNADHAQIQHAHLRKMLGGKELFFQIHTELGTNFFDTKVTVPPYNIERMEMMSAPIRITHEPLGAIIHAASEKWDLQRIYSPVQGFLAGNFNILLLPCSDGGFTLSLFHRLTETVPQTRSYFCVMDLTETNHKILKLADGAALMDRGELREFLPPGCRILERNLKTGFVYISGFKDRREELMTLAEHIMETGPMVSTACQVIYLDTDSFSDVRDFCTAFLSYLEKAAQKFTAFDLFRGGKSAVMRQTQILEHHLRGKSERKVLQGHRCSLIACDDSFLEPSCGYGCCLVKPLPSTDLVHQLRKDREKVFGAGLICSPKKRDQLIQQLIAGGVSRITDVKQLSARFAGEAYYGSYPLRDFSRIVNVTI